MAQGEEGVRIRKAKDLLKENGYELIPEHAIKCCDCGVIKTVNQSGNYYASTSDRHKSCTALHKPAKGNRKTAPKPVIRSYVPYCGNCLIKDKDFNNVSDFVDTLSLMDKPFIKSIYDKNMTKHDGSNNLATLGRYCKDLALNHSECHFKDSDNWESATGLKEDLDIMSEENESCVSRETIEFFGNGYKDREYIAMQNKYDFLLNNFDDKTNMHVEALKTYVRYRVKEELATADDKVSEADKWSKMASEAAKMAKINPSQLSKADLSEGLSTLSELSLAVEKAVDIIPILPQFKYRPNDALDFNIWCYVNYERHLRGYPLVEYSDVYKFYDERISDYIEQYGDPYGIFEEDPSSKNRDKIKNFIKLEDIDENSNTDEGEE